MKVYLSSSPTKGPSADGFNKVPQIKIKNKKLEQCGFTIGAQFKVIYTRNKILLKVISLEEN